jgi:hypothetical protein
VQQQFSRQCHDLDVVSSAPINTLASAVSELGFGSRVGDFSRLQTLNTPWGPLRVIPPTL